MKKYIAALATLLLLPLSITTASAQETQEPVLYEDVCEFQRGGDVLLEAAESGECKEGYTLFRLDEPLELELPSGVVPLIQWLFISGQEWDVKNPTLACIEEDETNDGVPLVRMAAYGDGCPWVAVPFSTDIFDVPSAVSLAKWREYWQYGTPLLIPRPGFTVTTTTTTTGPGTNTPITSKAGACLAESLETLPGVISGTSRDETIVRLYRVSFCRPGEPDGLLWWMEPTISMEEMTLFFAYSPEMMVRYGELTDAEYVKQIYENAYGVPPTLDQLIAWQGMMKMGTMYREEFLLMVANDAAYIELIETN